MNNHWYLQALPGNAYSSRLVYRAEMDVELEGDLKFKNWQLPGSPSANDVDIDWDNPQTLVAGLRYHLDDRNTLWVAN